MFTLKTSDIPRLAKFNHFPMPDTGMIFFGLRGCLPVLDDSTEFKDEHPVEVSDFNHINPRCTIGQYSKDKGIALYPGSTVPAIKHVRLSKINEGNGTNMLLSGYYHDYRKGWHKAGSSTGHEAFRQSGNRPIRRTADDLDYDNDDRIEYMNPFDNIHAAWCMGIYADDFASAGCQVIIGYPSCERRQGAPASGPWKAFRENAYAITQDRFDYMLLDGRDAMKVAFNRRSKLSPRLRYGSQGELVKKVQKKLAGLQFYEGQVDGDFGFRTLRAVMEMQETYFGKNGDDGIVGPVTASALGINW